MPLVLSRTKKQCIKCKRAYYKLMGTKDAVCLCDDRTPLEKIKENEEAND